MSNKIKKYSKTYDYGSRTPVRIDINELSETEKQRLIKSEVFCILPWIHLHGWPTGEAYPCCVAVGSLPVGNLKKETMEEIWHGEKMNTMRQNMLNETPCRQCKRCYTDEKHGLVSMRNNSNKHFGHFIKEVKDVNADFKIRFWDVRFSNICNFKCRYCGPNFSSNWWEDEAVLYGRVRHDKFLHAGKDKEDIWTQMQPHLPYIEQIYFAGGEPLIMEEHYRLLKYLVENNRTDVRLIYNTNFSELKFKKQDVLEWWKKFESVSVGASLDAMGSRAEYMRKGTDWDKIEINRNRMLEVCPNVNFFISATVNIFNAIHITDFHRDWINKGFIKAQDFNINILNGPNHYRCDILPQKFKDIAVAKIENTIEWLKDKDHLTRATNGYKGLINFLNGQNDPILLKHFFDVTDKLDDLRKEKFENIFPEYRDLRNFI